jgi:site-specific recombinase XerD
MTDTRPLRFEQLPLFPAAGVHGEKGRLVSTGYPLTRTSSLSAGMGAFYDHMRRKGFSDHTVKAFMADLRLLGKYSGLNAPLGRFGNRDLTDFLTWMVEYRGVPCSPKSYGRRVTTLKVFFAWLHEIEVLERDPAVAIPHHPARTPLPRFLYDNQVKKLLATTYDWMVSDDHPDPRPHFLASLLLQTGIKKSECVAITLGDIDRSNPDAPVLYIRYQNPRYRHKERKLALSADLMPALERYLAAYTPHERLFECTPRNLEYVLTEAGERAGLSVSPSFEALRWTCAVRDFRNGMEADRLRDKLGLSNITWHETVEKLKQLAGPGL